MSQPDSTISQDQRSQDPRSQVPRVPKMRSIGWLEIRLAISRGLGDFVRAPLIGLSFGLVLAASGALAIAMITVVDAVWFAVLIAVLLPLVFPFFAAGLYDVSRRLASGRPATWGSVISAIWGQRERQMGWIAFVMLFIFWIWIYQVRILLAIFMGLSASANLERFLQLTVSTSGGLSFLAVGSLIGLVLALVLFSATVISLPLLFENELDFVTGLITSFQTVAKNLAPMLGLGVLLTIATVLAVVPAFLGLIFIVPIFGHSTWHLYKIASATEAE